MREHACFDSIETVREVRSYVSNNNVFAVTLTAAYFTTDHSFSINSILQSRSKLFTPLEIAQIGSLVPKTAEEAMALIPSLAQKEEFADNNLLQEILDEVLAVRCFYHHTYGTGTSSDFYANLNHANM